MTWPSTVSFALPDCHTCGHVVSRSEYLVPSSDELPASISSPPSRRQYKPFPPSVISPFAPQQPHMMAGNLTDNQGSMVAAPQPSSAPPASRKRKAVDPIMKAEREGLSSAAYGGPDGSADTGDVPSLPSPTAAKKSRTNTPWTPAEERRLKIMRDAGSSWSEIAKTFPMRTEGSVKKHWYKDMHYADFAEDEWQSAALLAAIKEYEASKWKVIGAKVGKPAKACEQYAKEHFGGRV